MNQSWQAMPRWGAYAASGLTLVADNDPRARHELAQCLGCAGLDVVTAASRREAFYIASQVRLNLVLLDLDLSGGDAITFVRHQRSYQPLLPIIVLADSVAESDRVASLMAGADDYISKPVSSAEVIARTTVVLRRGACGSSEPSPATTLRFGDITLDLAARSVVVDGSEVSLTPKEFDLLSVLAQHPGRAFSRVELLADVWRSHPEWQSTTTVTVHIRRLREKIEANPAEPQHVRTVYGHGYRLDV